MKNFLKVSCIVSGVILCLFIILYIIGGIIVKKPLISEKEIILDYNVKNIWEIVVNNSDYQWRTGIHKIELLENGNWIEYYDEKGKNFTKFTLKDKEENTFYSFEMENKNFYGNWTGKFIEIDVNKTKCIFTETIYIKNNLMGILAKMFWNLEKLQEQYFNDLKKRLEN